VRGDLRFLSIEDVELLHADLIERYGGSRQPGHRGAEGVSAAVAGVSNSYYEDVFDLSAAYAVYIVMGHVFGDGNKRTASATMLVFLRLNGVRIDARPEELRDLMLDLQVQAESDPRPMTSDVVDTLAGWLRRHRRR
jgi:death-on-curing protein